MVPLNLHGIYNGTGSALFSNSIHSSILFCYETCCAQITFPQLLSVLLKCALISRLPASVLVSAGLLHVQVYV